VCDCFAPGLAAAYAIGRIGCHLSGDGDYGPPSTLPWAMAYPSGIVPTLERVHPTPVYEALMMGTLALVLWRLGCRPWAGGRLFGLYLLLAGAERFAVEFVRLNLVLAWQLTAAQWISIPVVVLGAWLFQRRRPSSDCPSAIRTTGQAV
jgi:phosphatidylglycerol:prolipoprotein diacylglycerol transferase